MTFRVNFIAGAASKEEFREAMALSEYDGLFIDPEDLRDPDPVLLSKRQEEVRILLQAGGAIVVFARPSIEIGTGVDNYSWLPSRPFELVERAGKSTQPVDRDGPFHPYFEAYGGSRDPELYFQVVLRGIPENLPGHRVLAVNKVGETTGLLYRELNGTVAVVPPIQEIDDTFRRILTEVLRRLRQRRSSLELAPEWVGSLPPLPGETEQRQAIATIEQQIAELALRRDNEQRQLDELRELKALLWESGTLGLESTVRQAFRVLGFSVGDEPQTESSIGNGALEFRADGKSIFCGVDASEETVHLEGFRRLHETITEALLEKGTAAGGILVGNGYRLKPLTAPERQKIFTESCLNGCGKFGYAAVPSSDLFRAIEAVLQRQETNDLRSSVRQSLLATAGLWRFEA